MTADRFVEIVRKGSDKLRVDEIILNTGEREIHGNGTLRIGQKSFKLDMTLNAGEAVPPFQTGIFTARDFWKLSGLIEHHLRFECKHVARYAQSNVFNGVTTFTLNVKSLELKPSGWDLMSDGERNSYLERLRREANGEPVETEGVDEVAASTKLPEGASVEFHAQLVNYPLISHGSGTGTAATNAFLRELGAATADAFIGEIEGFEFALVKKEEDGDLHVHLRSKADHRSPSEEADWVKFDALMNALAFTHGVNAWPYRTEYWRDGRKMLDRVTPARRLAGTTHAPFTKRLYFDAMVHNREWNLQDALGNAAAFFERNSPLSKEVIQTLFLFREADNGVHHEITVLALCTLFESLGRLIFDELNLKEEALKDNDAVGLFEQAKVEELEHISEKIATRSEQPAAKIEGYNRLLRAVSSLGPFTQREIFQADVSHFGLTWQDDMEVLFNTWRNARNPLVHHKERAGQSEDEVKNSMLDESRIAGAINILLLKPFGYSGWMRSSAFEDKYRQI